MAALRRVFTFASQRSSVFARPASIGSLRAFSGDEWGRGAGKGGGSGGSIRDAGGAFGKREAALEERYIHELELENIRSLKKHLEEEVQYHQHQIKRHKEAIERHEKKMKALQPKKKD